MLFKMFRQPYLSEDDGTEAGGMADAILPDDFSDEPEAETNQDEAEGTEEDQQAQQAETAEETVQKLMIKYNKEEKEITLDEAKELAQKGLNYDKVLEKINSLENSPQMQYFKQVAEKNNMSVEEVIEAYQKQDQQREIEEIAQQFNVSNEIATRLYNAERNNNELKTRVDSIEQTKQTEEAKQKEFDEFIDNFPDVKPEDIPKEVWEMKESSGKSLTDAMTKYENKNLKERILKLEQNLNNSQKAPLNGGISEHGSEDNLVADDFLDGFNSEI